MGKGNTIFDVAAQRTILGEKTFLETVEPSEDGEKFWIRPRKYSVEGRDEVKRAAKEYGASIPKEVLKKIVPLAAEKKKEPTYEEILEALEPEEIAAVLSEMDKPKAGLIKAILLYGIDSHNLTESGKVNEEMVENLMNYPDPSDECVKIVKDHNRPLAKETSEK